MVLNRREKILIGLLAGMVLLGVYYKFLLVPLGEDLSQLRLDKQEKEFEYLQAKQKLASEVQLKDDTSNLHNEIFDFAGVFFGSMQQEDVILLLNDFILENTLRISSLSFLEARTETFYSGEEDQEASDENQLTVEVFSAQINFESDYEGLMDFLQRIREYDKKILAKNLRINNNSGGQLSGNLLLDFYSVPEVDKYLPQENSILHFATSGEDEEKVPWNPFTAVNFFDEAEEGSSLIESGGSMEVATQENLTRKTLLYGFESENIFFVGEPRDIFGMISLDTNSIEGRYAAKVQYDFIRGREYNAANLVFEGDPITIIRQPEILALSIYAYENNNHRIGVVLIDSKGREFKVPLVQGVDWFGWRSVETTLPVEVTYPAVLQRIYMESEDFADKLKGHFLFDKLEVAYPEVSSFSNDILGRDE
ncbi:hypothetical protein [Clostridium formicaceticum]|uniref:General secretion pathway, M protein n=1 Tax=Clostridium formicaceticum TaxID=1497 RepID=A0AAC9WG34_9CLOT|nr:hypothetical protein [Clostridium formicaceticum]ARE87552.1 General secretion pathway, M protein [Clostridium formicaceticum]